ncbi:MAG: hypothetical protein HUU35_12370, partial [Armatimonadetes bacterium]|nr:hypothetical protein [Armatimonadota bacterium]
MERTIGRGNEQHGRRRRRHRWVQAALAVVGLGGLLTLVLLLDSSPRLQAGARALLYWQVGWYLVRLALMLGIWRREPQLSATEKAWMGLTTPVYLLFVIWWFRGR